MIRNMDPKDHATEAIDDSEEHASSGSIDLPVENWDRYKMEALIGEGGMARVYKAFDPQLKRYVALKFIRGDNPVLTERLLKEARAQAQLEHEHVCKIYEVGEENGKRYIAMQFIKGDILQTAAKEMTLEQKIKVMVDVSNAIQSAHRAGIIHRDLKPSNIMVERTEDASFHSYVMDFGIARELSSAARTATSDIMGTPSFMSPEQIFSDPTKIDRRADIYGLGACMYSILLDRAPFEGPIAEVLVKLISEDPVSLRMVDPSIPKDIETIVMKCLEKDPSQRYDSARALSEDLKRYLEGEPILAIPLKWKYRLSKKIKKNKLTSALLAAFLLLLIIASSALLYSWWRTEKQVRLAQQFSQEVEAVDWVMRMAHMSPIHDVRNEKAKIRDRMKRIQAAMADAGSLSFGPGNYAVGKGYLILQEHESAKKHLDTAWKNGYRSPEIAYALGLTLGSLYQKGLSDVERMESSVAREKRLKDLEKDYRDPALQLLRQSKGAWAHAPEFVEGLIAFYEKRYGEALAKAKEASVRLPWFYESKILEGDIYYARGITKSDIGNKDQSIEDLTHAEAAYRNAIRIGQSDARAYGGVCNVYSKIFRMQVYEKKIDLESLKNDAIAACSLALQVEPENTSVLYESSLIQTYWGEHLEIEGKDPSESLKTAFLLAEKVIKLKPNHDSAYESMGLGLRTRGNYEALVGKNPEESFRAAAKAFDKALKIDSNNGSTWNSLGLLYNDLAYIEMSNGKDPRHSLQQSVKAMHRALQINPNKIHAIANLGWAYSHLGKYEMEHGHDPIPSLNLSIQYLNLSIQHLEQTKAKLASNVFPYRWLLYVHRNLGEHRLRMGEDPSNEFALAEQSFQDGIGLTSKDAILHKHMARIPILKAKLAVDGNDSPIVELRKAAELMKTALQYDPTDSATYVQMGMASLLEARWEMSRNKNPEASFAKSKTSFGKALKLDAEEPTGHIGMAELYYWSAHASRSNVQVAESLIQQGLEQCKEAIRIDATSATAYGVRGMLLHLRANLKQNQQDEIAAADSFRKALSLNKFLANQLKPWLVQIAF